MRVRPAALVLLLLVGPAWGADQAVLLPPAPAMEPLRLAEEVARYTPDTLWERIDGEAELYRRFGLRESIFALYALDEKMTRRVEVAIHAVDEPLDAFGLFATYAPPKRTLVPLGNGGVVGDNQAFFWHGNTFILADALGPIETRKSDLERAVNAVNARLGPAPARPALLAAFELVARPESVRYAPDHLLSRGLLPRGVQGDTLGGTVVFLAILGPNGREIMDAYRESLKDAKPVAVPDASGWAGTDPDLGPVIWLVRQSVLAGAKAPADRPGLLEVLQRLLTEGAKTL